MSERVANKFNLRWKRKGNHGKSNESEGLALRADQKPVIDMFIEHVVAGNPDRWFKFYDSDGDEYYLNTADIVFVCYCTIPDEANEMYEMKQKVFASLLK